MECVWRKTIGVIDVPLHVWQNPIREIIVHGLPKGSRMELCSGAYVTVASTSSNALQFSFSNDAPEPSGPARIAWLLAQSQHGFWPTDRPLMAPYIRDLNLRVLPAPAWVDQKVTVSIR